MLTREDLLKSGELNHKLKNLKLRREQLFSACTGGSIEYDKEKVKTSVTQNKEVLLAILADLDSEILSLENDKKMLDSKVLKYVVKLNPTENAIFLLRYVRGMTWEKIAESLVYSRSQVHRIHNDVVKSLPSKKDATP